MVLRPVIQTSPSQNTPLQEGTPQGSEDKGTHREGGKWGRATIREGFQEAAGKRWDGCLRALLQGRTGPGRGSTLWAALPAGGLSSPLQKQ